MEPIYNYLVVMAFSVYVLILIWEVLRSGFSTSINLQITFLLALGIILHLTLEFPNPTDRQSFGPGVSPFTMIGIMYTCILMGIVGQFVYSSQKNSYWKGLAKPLCVSPIVLMPLMGSVQHQSNIETMQIISFGILAFQNGFFWKLILEKTRDELTNI